MFRHFICVFLLLAPSSHSQRQPALAYDYAAVTASTEAVPTTGKPAVTTTRPTRKPTTPAPLLEDDDLASRDGRRIEANSFQVNPGPASDQIKLKTDSGIFIVTSTPKIPPSGEKSNIDVYQNPRGNIGHRQPQPASKVEKTKIEYPKLAPPPTHKQVQKEKEPWQAVSRYDVSPSVPERSGHPTHSTNNPYSRKDYYPSQDNLSRRVNSNDVPQQLYEAPVIVQAAEIPSNDIEPPPIIVANDSSFESFINNEAKESPKLDLSGLTKNAGSVVLTKTMSVEKQPDTVHTVHRPRDESLLGEPVTPPLRKGTVHDVHNSANRPSASGSLFEGGRVETTNEEPRKLQGLESRQDAVSLFDAEAETKETSTSASSLLETRDELRRVPYFSAPQLQDRPQPPAPPPSSEQRNQVSFTYASLNADLTEMTDIGSIIESVSNSKRRAPIPPSPAPPVGPSGKPFGGTQPPSPPGQGRPPSPPGTLNPPYFPSGDANAWSNTDVSFSPSANIQSNDQNHKPLVVIYNVHPGVHQSQLGNPATASLALSPAGIQPPPPLQPVVSSIQQKPIAIQGLLPPGGSSYGISPPAIAQQQVSSVPVQQQPAAIQVQSPVVGSSYGIAPPSAVQQQLAAVQVPAAPIGTSYGVAPPATSFSLPSYVLQDQRSVVKAPTFSSQPANFPGSYAIPPSGADQTGFVSNSGYGFSQTGDSQSFIVESDEIRSIPVNTFRTTSQVVSPVGVALQPQIISLGGTLSGSPIRTVVRTRTRLADSSQLTRTRNQLTPSSSYNSYAGRRQTDQELSKRSSYAHQKPKSSYGVPQAPAYAPPAYAPPKPTYDYYAPAPPAPPASEPVVQDEVQQFLQPVYYQPLPSFQFNPVVGKGKKKEKDKEKEKGKFKFFGKDKKCSKHVECGSNGGISGQSDEGIRGEQEITFSDPTGLFGPNEQLNFQYQYRGGAGEGPLHELKRVFYSGAIILGAMGMLPTLAMTFKSLLPVAAVAAGRRKRDLLHYSGVWNETAWEELNRMTKTNSSLFDALPHSGAPIPEDLRQELEPYVPSFETFEHTECLQKQFCENLLETGRHKYKENILLFYSFLSPDAEENPWLMQSLTAARKNKCSDFYCTAGEKKNS